MAFSVSYIYEILNKYSAPAKKIAADTEKIANAARKATAVTKKHDAALNKATGATKKASAAANTAAVSTNKLAGATKKAAAASSDSRSKIDQAKRSINDHTSAIDRNTRSLNRNKAVSTAAARSAGKQARVSGVVGAGGIGTLRGKLRGVKDSMLSAQGAMMGFLGTVGMAASGRTYVSFVDSVNMLAATTRASAEDMKRMTDRAKELGKTTQFTTSQVLESMNFLAMAGFDTNKILGAVSGTLDMAAASNLDLGRAADITTNVLGQMGLEISQLSTVSDILSVAQSKANFTTEELYGSLKTMGATAKNLGIPLRMQAALLGIMANQGEKAENAGTLARNAFTEMLNPTRKQAVIYRKLGINLKDYLDKMGRIKDMTAFIGRLKDIQKQGRLTVGDLEILFGKRGFRAMQLWLTAGTEEIKKLHTAFKDVNGASKEMAKIRMRGIVGMLKSLASAWEAVNLAIFERGGLGKILTDIGYKVVLVTRNLSALRPEVLKFIGILGALVMAAGPAMLIAGALAAALSALLSPIGAVVIGAGVLAAAITAFAIRNDKVMKSVGSLFSALKALGLSLYGVVEPVVQIISKFTGGETATSALTVALKALALNFRMLALGVKIATFPLRMVLKLIQKILDTKIGKAFTGFISKVIGGMAAITKRKVEPVVSPKLDLSGYYKAMPEIKPVAIPATVDVGEIESRRKAMAEIKESIAVSREINSRVRLDGQISVSAERGSRVNNANMTNTSPGNLGINISGAF